jgi:hypothetical protein
MATLMAGCASAPAPYTPVSQIVAGGGVIVAALAADRIQFKGTSSGARALAGAGAALLAASMVEAINVEDDAKGQALRDDLTQWYREELRRREPPDGSGPSPVPPLLKTPPDPDPSKASPLGGTPPARP